jgi:hypothetical protein
MSEFEEIVMQETGQDADFYVSSKSFGPDERDTNYNAGDLNLGVRDFGNNWRIGLGLNIAGRYPAGVVFNAVSLRLKSWGSFSSGRDVEVQIIPTPIVFDAQATFNKRTSLQNWAVPGIDVQAPPPAIVTSPLAPQSQVLLVQGLEEIWQDAWDNRGGIVNVRLRVIPETGADRWEKFRSSAYSVQADRPTWLVTFTVPINAGYKLFLRPGVPPNPLTDVPVATVDSAALAAVLDAGSLGLAASSEYYGLVVAFNTVGDSVSGAPFTFSTDVAGLPLIVPTPVTGIKATPLAGGNLRVAWTYREKNPLANADTFEVEVAGDAGTFPFSVPHVVPRRDYTRDLPVGAEGLFQVRVRAARAGLYQPSVSPVPVVLDATPPAVVPVALEAVE